MITKETATSLVESWACLAKFPTQTAARARLARELRECARDDQHANRIAAHFTSVCPTPSDIQDAARVLGPKLAGPMDEMRAEYRAEVERALRQADREALDYYSSQHPEIVAEVRAYLMKRGAAGGHR